MNSHPKNIASFSTAGMWLSILCALHCFAGSVLVAVAPILGSLSLLDESVESFLIFLSLALATLVLALSWRVHRQTSGLAWFLPAVLLILAGRFLAEGVVEPIVVITGALLLATSQFVNFRAIRRCTAC